jgi:hypothetical protein
MILGTSIGTERTAPSCRYHHYAIISSLHSIVFFLLTYGVWVPESNCLLRKMKTENCETIFFKTRENSESMNINVTCAIIYIFQYLFCIIYAAINLYFFIFLFIYVDSNLIFPCSVPGSRATVKARLRSLRSWSARHSGARSSSMQRIPTINFQPTSMWIQNSGKVKAVG